MNQSSPPFEEIARKNEAQILRAFQLVTQEKIADRLGVSGGTVSKLKSEGDITNASRVLAAAGLKVVPVDFECHDPRYIASLEFLSHRHLTDELREQQADETDTEGSLQWT